MSTDLSTAEVTAADEGQLVAFKLGDVEFGVDIKNVREIVRLPEITPIPQAPDYVAGICNLRGNVLPVINTRTRFNMKEAELNQETRLLVVDTGGIHTGLIVDDVKEVMQLEKGNIDPPPAVCKGVDREFLSGIVKIDQGKRLVLILDLKEVVNIIPTDSTVSSDTSSEKISGSDTVTGALEDEEQLVTFKMANEEYAFGIESVREILRVNNITHVPNVPPYVKGLFTIRNQLMPVLELRTLLGMSDLTQEHAKEIDLLNTDLCKWREELKHCIESDTQFNGVKNLRESPYGKWSDNYNSSNAEIVAIMKNLKNYFLALYRKADEILILRKSDRENALKIVESEISPVVQTVMDLFQTLKRVIAAHTTEDQRVMVVESESMSVGYLVDMVNEVVRIPKSIIDQTPEMAKSDRKELRGIAKLKKGERLIMIINETALVSKKDTALISQVTSDGSKNGKSTDLDSRSLAQQALDEEQLVTFSIGKEEYGIPVMQVQEINRLTDITTVPRAPKFIDGVTNLRGSVIPVVNIRTFFGLPKKDRDDRTRVIIVELGGVRTGLCVDQVNEVLRVSRANVVKTPSLITSSGVNKYLDGVLKLNDGKRMVVTLTIEKMLNDTEMAALAHVDGSEDRTDISGSDDGLDTKGQKKKSGGKGLAKKQFADEAAETD